MYINRVPPTSLITGSDQQYYLCEQIWNKNTLQPKPIPCHRHAKINPNHTFALQIVLHFRNSFADASQISFGPQYPGASIFAGRLGSSLELITFEFTSVPNSQIACSYGPATKSRLFIWFPMVPRPAPIHSCVKPSRMFIYKFFVEANRPGFASVLFVTGPILLFELN